MDAASSPAQLSLGKENQSRNGDKQAGGLWVLAGKLVHPLAEVRVRALQNLDFKLKHGLIKQADLDVTLLRNVLGWFNLDNGQAQDVAMLDFLHKAEGQHSPAAWPFPSSSQAPYSAGGSGITQTGSFTPGVQQTGNVFEPRSSPSGNTAGTFSRPATAPAAAGNRPGTAGSAANRPASQSGVRAATDALSTPAVPPDERAMRARARADWRQAIAAPASSAGEEAPLSPRWRLKRVPLGAADDQFIFDLNVRLQYSDDSRVLLQALEELHWTVCLDMPPEALLQRPAVLDNVLSLLHAADKDSPLPASALRVLHTLACRLKWAIGMAVDPAYCPPARPASGASGSSTPVRDPPEEAASRSYPAAPQDAPPFPPAALAVLLDEEREEVDVTAHAHLVAGHALGLLKDTRRHAQVLPLMEDLLPLLRPPPATDAANASKPASEPNADNAPQLRTYLAAAAVRLLRTFDEEEQEALGQCRAAKDPFAGQLDGTLNGSHAAVMNARMARTFSQQDVDNLASIVCSASLPPDLRRSAAEQLTGLAADARFHATLTAAPFLQTLLSAASPPSAAVAELDGMMLDMQLPLACLALLAELVWASPAARDCVLEDPARNVQPLLRLIYSPLAAVRRAEATLLAYVIFAPEGDKLAEGQAEPPAPANSQQPMKSTAALLLPKPFVDQYCFPIPVAVMEALPVPSATTHPPDHQHLSKVQALLAQRRLVQAAGGADGLLPLLNDNSGNVPLPAAVLRQSTALVQALHTPLVAAESLAAVMGAQTLEDCCAALTRLQQLCAVHAVAATVARSNWAAALQRLLTATPASPDDKALWLLLLPTLDTLVASHAVTGNGLQLLAMSLKSAALPLLATKEACAGQPNLPIALANHAGAFDGAGNALLTLRLVQVIMLLLARILKEGLRSGDPQLCRRLLEVLDVPPLLQLLLPGFIANAEAAYGSRVAAVQLLTQIVACAGDTWRLSRGQLGSPWDSCLVGCLGGLIRHVCMPRHDTRLGGFREKALLREALHCLHQVTAAVPASCWAPAWQSVGGTFWLTRLARDRETGVRAAAMTLLACLASPAAPVTRRMLLQGWPECGSTALKVALQTSECYAVRAAALRFVCAAMAASTAQAHSERQTFWHRVPRLLQEPDAPPIFLRSLTASADICLAEAPVQPEPNSPAGHSAALLCSGLTSFYSDVFGELSQGMAAETLLRWRATVAAALRALLAYSAAAKMRAVQTGLPEALLDCAADSHALMALAAGQAAPSETDARIALVKAGATESARRMWKMALSNDALLHELLGLLANMLPGCPSASTALCTQGNVPLLARLLKLLSKTQLELPSFHRVTVVLRNLAASADGAALLLKTGFLADCQRLIHHSLHAKDSARLAALLPVLVNVAAHAEGQKCILRSSAAPGLLDLILSCAEQRSGPASAAAFFLLRNLTFALENKAHFVTNHRALPLLLAAVERGAEQPEAAAYAASALWGLVYQGEKVKAALRGLPSLRTRLQSAHSACAAALRLAKPAGPSGQGSGVALLPQLVYSLEVLGQLLDPNSTK
ncbi:hypothetical protein WJX72_010621 [[Myrmecia] bisecta]|uniref:Rotatin N-terminal domain-containing protein n=1 Tax=[Myrmecia] bisecta TaxID=41462 RepID=A0AAW1QSL1_9CHLO